MKRTTVFIGTNVLLFFLSVYGYADYNQTLQGTWTTSYMYEASNNTYLKITMIISENELSSTYDGFWSESDCLNNSNFYTSTLTGTFSIGDNIDTLDVKELDIMLSSCTITWLTDDIVNYVNAYSWYGINDWQKDVPRDISGKTHPNGIIYPAIGEMYFSVIKIDGNKVYLGTDDAGFILNEESRSTTLESWFYTKDHSTGVSAREDHSSVIYNDNIYIIGGETNDNSLDSLWVYNISTDLWTQKADISKKTGCHSAVLYNDKIYLFGGSLRIKIDDEDPRVQYSDIQVYDITNNKWDNFKPIGPAPRDHHTAALYNDKMLIYGGEWDSPPPNTFGDLWVYDITSNTWLQKCSNINLSHHSAIVYNGKMYIFGGVVDNGLFTNNLWVYNICSDSWIQKQDAPFSRAEHSAIVYNDKMYIFGGVDGSFNVQNELWEYDFCKDTWIKRNSSNPSLSKRAMHSAVLYNGDIFIFGGINEHENQLDDIWRFKIPKDVIWDIDSNKKWSLPDILYGLQVLSGIRE